MIRVYVSATFLSRIHDRGNTLTLQETCGGTILQLRSSDWQTLCDPGHSGVTTVPV
jgi:hypothetical protein